MKKEELKITRYLFNDDDNDNYFIYLIPEEGGFTSFYIQKKECGIMCHCVGLKIDKIDNIQKFINDNIQDWISECNENLELTDIVTERFLLFDELND